ncbi:hypothetical protein JB92DRAFT_2834431 [Gautieria morchelliformis]|nr:hypothetical protein JB92DRAFT_2834431 [Gautieria morchelliformis]
MLSAEEDAILQPARALARNSREVVIGVPGIGAAAIAYPLSHLEKKKIVPRNLGAHFAKHGVTLHCLCLLISQSAAEDSQCVLRVNCRIEADTTSSCKECQFYINWSTKFPTATRMRDYSEERWVTLLFGEHLLHAQGQLLKPYAPVYYLPPGEQSSVPSTHRPLHQAQKSTAHISTGGKPPRITPSELHWLSLSPTPSTTSVGGYIMSTDRTPLQALPPVPCPFVASSMALVASTSSTPSSAGSHTWGPDFASMSLAASHTGIQIADGPNGPYVHVFKDAGNEHCAITDWEKNCLFECDDPKHGHTCVKPNQVLPFLKMFTRRILNTGSPTHGHTQDPKHGLSDTWTHMCETEPGPSIPSNSTTLSPAPLSFFSLSFTLAPSSPQVGNMAVPLLTFTHRMPTFSMLTMGLLEINKGIERQQQLGVAPRFWVAVALAYLEFLTERDSYLTAVNG